MAQVIQFVIEGKNKFGKVAKATTDGLKKIGNAASVAAKTVRRIGLAVVAAGTALVFFTSRMADAQDRAAKFSTRLGIAVDQLTAYQFAAQQSGIETAQFNMGVQRMTRRVAEAAQGLGEARGALVELGIDARSFAKLGFDEQMQTLADRFSNMDDEAKKLRLAFKLFDSEGTAMLQLLKQGSPAMRKMAEDAQFLGLVVGKQAAANAEAFSDAFGRAKGAITGVSRGVANELIPLFTGLFNKFANWLASNREAITNWVKGAIVNVFTFGKMLGQVFDRIGELVTFSGDAWSSFLDGIADFVIGAGRLFLSFGKIIVKSIWAGLKATFKVVQTFKDWFWGALSDIFAGREIRSLGDMMRESMLKNGKQAIAEIRAAVDAERKEIADGSRQLISGFNEAWGINIEAARAAAIAQVDALSEVGVVAQEQGAAMLETARTTFDELKLLADDFLSQLGTTAMETARILFDSMQNMVKGISNAVGDALTGGKNLADGLKQVAKQVLKQVIAAFVQMGIQRLVLSKITQAAVTQEASVEAGKAIGMTAANYMKSMAAAPWPINMTAPAVAAAGMAQAAGLFSAGMAQGKALGGIAHGGLDYVPKESTYLLDKGERVLSPNQNRDLTQFIRGEGGQGLVINELNISVMENVTTPEALRQMSDEDIGEEIAFHIVRGLDYLGDRGVLPKATQEVKR